MRVDEIKNGIVIDHIEGGKSMDIYDLLQLGTFDCPVAILRNVPSRKMGKKDIIKIDGHFDIDFNLLGFISPTITVDIINDGHVTEKKHIDLPEKVMDIIKCKNPRCISSVEQEIHHIFYLADRQKGIYRCTYCDAKA
ncbi:MAG: aspartate carbamoyltransferase regulatory subunit [Oscillospiraceae bacterium]|nr:aspartate carbamoyltransferase regulatory subunit [Oscillospiraceae bacterium]